MSDWSGKNVFVTGATGFIGGAVSDRLVSGGANVVCLARNSSRRSSYLIPCVFYEGSVTDFDLMREIISMHEIEYVFHFAANAIVRIGARDPMSTYNTNVMGTVSLLEAVRVVGRCKKIVVASSDKAYGDHEVLPYLENMSLQPKNTYDTSKACADMIARSYAHNYRLPVVVTRCSNVYGPGDMNFSRIIPNSIMKIFRGEPPELYSDVSSMEREFVYINDVVDACLSLALSGEDSNGQAFNVGGTGAHSVEYVSQLILRLMNSKLETKIVPRESVFKEIQKQYIDASKLKAATGWAPTMDLERGLEQTIRWYREMI